MQMEDLLPARRLVELLEQKALGLHAGHDRAADLLHRRHEARQIFGVEVKERARGRLRNDERVSFGARHHVHEGQGHIVLVDLDAWHLAAKDLGEDVVGLIRRRQRLLPGVRPLARRHRRGGRARIPHNGRSCARPRPARVRDSRRSLGLSAHRRTRAPNR